MSSAVFGLAEKRGEVPLRLASGNYIDLESPLPPEINLNDVATGLSNICRFGGQTKKFYSVAEHSVLCAEIAREAGGSPRQQLAALLHDAPEAYCGDIVTPLKAIIGEDWRRIERVLTTSISVRFDVNLDLHEKFVKLVDQTALIIEKKAIDPTDETVWEGEGSVIEFDVSIKFLRPEAARESFLKEYLHVRDLVRKSDREHLAFSEKLDQD